jgi:hypothetical protein
MTTVHKPRLLTDAVAARLAAQTGKSVGEGERPEGASPPYAVVHPAPTRATHGGLTDPNQIRQNTFHVVYVGDTVDEAQWMQEKCQQALLGWAPTVTGFTPGVIELDQENLFSRSDLDGPTYEIADRYLVYVS